MTMSVGFQPIISNETCGICLDSLGTAEAVAHTGNDGPKHPWHKDCIKGWIITSGTSRCPSCRVPMDKSSLLTTKEKVVLFWKESCMTVVVLAGLLSSIFVSAEITKKVITILEISEEQGTLILVVIWGIYMKALMVVLGEVRRLL